MTTRILIPAATWTDVSAEVATVGQHVVLRGDADMQVGRKVLAPTAGVAVAEGIGAEVIVKAGDTLVPWVYGATAFMLEITSAGGSIVILDGTGTT